MTEDEKTIHDAIGDFWISVDSTGYVVYADGDWNNPEPIDFPSGYAQVMDSITDAVSDTARLIKLHGTKKGSRITHETP